MREFLFAVILSLVLMVSVAFIAVMVPGAKLVFAFCGVCSVAFVALAYYERRKYAREARARLDWANEIAASRGLESSWEQMRARMYRQGKSANCRCVLVTKRDTVRE